MDEFGNPGAPIEDTQTTHYVKSTVLGGAMVAELGWGDTIHIYAGGQRIAREFWGNVTFEHHNPMTGSWVTSHGHSSYRTTYREERDPRGAETPLSNPYGYAENYVDWKFSQPLFIEGGDPFDYVSGYTLDGLPMSRSQLNHLVGKLPSRTILFDVYKTRDPFELRFIYSHTFAWEVQSEKTPTRPKLPKVKDATPEQQTRFNDGYNEFWDRLHKDDGNNPCAKLFGGVKKAEKALKDTKYAFGPTQGRADAQIIGKNMTINPNGVFMKSGDEAKLLVGFNLRAHEGSYVRLTDAQLAAFVLAHEIGHRAGVLRPDGRDPFGFLSTINNGLVHTACFSDIDSWQGPLPDDP